MALIKLGMGFSAIKGKLNGTIYQGYRGKVMASTLVNGGGRKTDHWAKVKPRFAELSKAWRGLRPGERDQWNAFALQMTFTDKFGDPYTPNGYQVFMHLNGNLVQADVRFKTSPPIGVKTIPIYSGEEVEIVGMQEKSIEISSGYLGNYNFQVFASMYTSPDNLKASAPLRLITQIPGNTTGPTNIYDPYKTVYGFNDPVGSAMLYMFRVLDTETGFVSQKVYQKLTFKLP